MSMMTWEGIIERVYEENGEQLFDVLLNDVYGKSPPHAACMAAAKMTEEDRKHIKEGAVFEWRVGEVFGDTVSIIT